MRFKSLAGACAALMLLSLSAYARAEMQLAGGPPNEIQLKVNEAALKYQKLFDEADELERQAERARSGQGP